MYLHENKKDFSDLILLASRDTGISSSIIEKDYYVTIFLSELVSLAPDIVFKGGTSLSKGYGIINRFSEDIDLNYDYGGKKPSESMRRLMKNAILSAGDKVGLEFLGSDRNRIPYKQDYLRYDFSYHAIFSNDSLKSMVLVETSVRSPSFPLNVCQIGSELQKYLEKIGDNESIYEFGLGTFPMKTQAIERTFADKLYAVADYYLQNMEERDSRHLYDLYCMRPYIKLDAKFLSFLNEIREVRRTQPNNPSAQSEHTLSYILQEVVDTDFYKFDYEKYTVPLLFDAVSYSDVKRNLQNIVTTLKNIGWKSEEPS